MSQVDFYILSQTGLAARERFACRLAEKAFGQGLSVYLHTESKPDSQRLDELLWTFSEQSFVPHQQLGDDDSAGPDIPKVLIGDAPPPAGFQVLIPLHQSAKIDLSQSVDRIAEVISADAPTKQLGRQRFRHYQEQSIKPNTHQL